MNGVRSEPVELDAEEIDEASSLRDDGPHEHLDEDPAEVERVRTRWRAKPGCAVSASTTCSMAITVLDAYAVQSYMGHQHYSTTQRYLHHQPRREHAHALHAAFGGDVSPTVSRTGGIPAQRSTTERN